jgi:hypothetical protein
MQDEHVTVPLFLQSRIAQGEVMTTTHEDGHGGRITILEHGSATTPMRFRALQPKGVVPPAPECHPSQTEDFRIIRGTLDLGVIDGKRVRLQAGDSYHLPAGVYHLPEHRGLAQFARVSVVFRRYSRVIAFKAPVRAAMIVVAAFARLVVASPARASRGQ